MLQGDAVSAAANSTNNGFGEYTQTVSDLSSVITVENGTFETQSLSTASSWVTLDSTTTSLTEGGTSATVGFKTTEANVTGNISRSATISIKVKDALGKTFTEEVTIVKQLGINECPTYNGKSAVLRRNNNGSWYDVIFSYQTTTAYATGYWSAYRVSTTDGSGETIQSCERLYSDYTGTDVKTYVISSVMMEGANVCKYSTSAVSNGYGIMRIKTVDSDGNLKGVYDNVVHIQSEIND